MLRISRNKQYYDYLRKYKIILDGKLIGKIAKDELKSFNIEPGNHTIYLKIDWCRSNKINFHVSENEDINFICENFSKNNFKGFLFPLYITLFKNKYLTLKEVS